MGVVAVLATNRHASKVEAVQYVRVDELGRQVERNDIEVSGAAMGVDREQWQAMFAQQDFEVGPWRIGPLRHCVLTLVEDLVQDLQALIGQADLVGVGIGKQPRHHAIVILRRYCPVFATDIASGLLDAT